MTLNGYFKKTILSPKDIIQKAIREKLVHPYDRPESIKENFSRLVEEIQTDAYALYRKSAKESGELAIRRILLERIGKNSDAEAVINACADMFEEFNSFFLSISQSRKTRAGSAFEVILKSLFKSLSYPFDEQQIINGKPDFLMPGRKHYDTNSMDCIIFTAKRTIRERWKQIVTEGTRGLGFYLATIDDKVSTNQLDEMKNNRIYLVVPASIKAEKYSAAHNAITFEEFFRHHLDPAVARWRANGIIT